ncbi:hypothetical protein NQ315_010757 [Exocentrus adspersus]|uniref:HTH psq-type domain-containing protein n=1 Tax=Exocentrus adspersus TaxID=1586481 RepID=A0AAV8VUL2_9CUCU|nr:hypothetical protein NQ315_010757 [Exocentrus adspersus]
MGRRKWKLYQESMSRSYLQPLNNNIKRINPSDDVYYKEAKHQQSILSSDSDLDKGESNQAREPAAPAREINGEGGRDGQDRLVHQKENERTEAEDRLKDWTPQSKCYFCVDGKLDSEHTAHGVLSPRPSDSDTSDSHSDSEVPASLTPTSRGLLNNNHHHRSSVQHPVTPPSTMTTIENVSMAALAVAALSGGSSPGAPAPHLPFYNPSVLTQNWYLANVARQFQSVSDGKGGGGEQPLDLSKGSSNNSNAMGEQKLNLGNSVGMRLPTLDTKHIFKAKPRMSAVAGRRTYTEDELQAALRDIQSGKLGTRRAAVIYGIPRSTLRNKVYKLALERERESHLSSSTPLKLDEEEAMDDDKELSGAEEEKEVEKALQGPLLSMADLFRFGRDQTPEALKHLLLRGKDGQDMWAGIDHGDMGPYIQNLLLASQSLLTNQKPPEGGMLHQMIPEFVKRMLAEEHLLKAQQNNNGDSEKFTRPSPSNSVITKVEKLKSESDMETDESPSNVILKIPSFKPTSSNNGCDLFSRSSVQEPTGSMASPPVTSESGSPPVLPTKGLIIKDVKDVIAQSISQKFQQTLEPRRSIIDMDFKRGGFTPPLGNAIPMMKTQDLSRPYQHPPKPVQNTSTGAPTGGKGTRPKRGKYRNYDRDSLVEAVRAVQRGEMSVHRAGSYYGVPHSTLEYKVKERHLMRPRKRDPKPNPVDEKIASLKQNDLRMSQDKMKPVMKPPQKFPPTSPNGMKLPIFEAGMTPLAGYNPPPFPFWPHPGFPHISPLEYAARNPTSQFPTPNPEFFASQMMQKLQEESSRTLGSSTQTVPGGITPALAKNARQMAESLLEGTGSNGSFLDGIIRSSLETGVPSSDDKSPKEEKNVAPENMSNKALLDQLCRNSRLTPLSKPAMTEANSSGDESYRKGSSPLNFVTGVASLEETNEDNSSSRYDKDGSDVHTIELSNDSNTSSERKVNEEERKQPRIYLKQDLVNPDNLKPEMLVRFREALPDMDHNGVIESAPSSASDNDAPQD